MRNFLTSKKFHSALGLLVSFAIIAWLYFTVEWEVVGRALVGANYLMLFPIVGVLLIHLFLRALRWRYLLNEGKHVPIKELFDAIVVGYFATFVLPLRAGEFIRPALLAMRAKVPFSICFVSIVLERFFDLSMVLLSFGVMVAYIPGIPPIAHQGAAALSVLALGIFGFILLSVVFPVFLQRLIDYFTKFLPEKIRGKIHTFFSQFLQAASVLHKGPTLLIVVLLSLALWGTNFWFFYLFLPLLNINASFWVGASIAIIVALAVAAPSAPGFIGVYQAACIAAFSLFSLGREQAVAYGVVNHVCQYIFFIGYGTVVLVSKGLRLKDIR